MRPSFLQSARCCCYCCCCCCCCCCYFCCRRERKERKGGEVAASGAQSSEAHILALSFQSLRCRSSSFFLLRPVLLRLPLTSLSSQSWPRRSSVFTEKVDITSWSCGRAFVPPSPGPFSPPGHPVHLRRGRWRALDTTPFQVT